MTTVSGKFRIFSIKDEPRYIPTDGMFKPDPEDLQGDWTYEPVNRAPLPLEKLQWAKGSTRPMVLYAGTYPDQDEALIQAEIWEKKDAESNALGNAFVAGTR